MHEGHEEYIQLGLKLAHRVVITVTATDFAQHWKSYKVSPLDRRVERIRRFLEQLEVDFEAFDLRVAEGKKDVDSILRQPSIDLAICVRQYYDDIESINQSRLGEGSNTFYILVKPETRTGGKILTSTDLLQGTLPFDRSDPTPKSSL